MNKLYFYDHPVSIMQERRFWWYLSEHCRINNMAKPYLVFKLSA